jgi:hypothetical protein
MKKATLALAGLMAIASAAQASWSRWNGFGAANAFIADVADQWTLPGVTASNPDALYVEFQSPANLISSGGADDWGGVHVAVGPGVLAIWGNRPYTENNNIAGGFTPPTLGGASTAYLTPAQMIDIIYGFKLSDTMDLGVGVSRAVNGMKDEDTTAGVVTYTDRQVSDLGITAGIEMKQAGPFELVEIGAQYNMGATAHETKGAVATDKRSVSATDMDVRVGADIKGDAFNQRIELGFNTDAMNFKAEPSAAPGAGAYVESKNSASAWNAGWAMSKSNDKGMGLAGVMVSGLTQSRNEDNNNATLINKFDANTMTVTVMAGGEAKANSWLTARGGFSSNLFQTTSTTTDAGPVGNTTKNVVTTPGAPGAAASAGLSATLGGLVIDGALAQSFVAGAGLGAFMGQLSATYSWAAGN